MRVLNLLLIFFLVVSCKNNSKENDISSNSYSDSIFAESMKIIDATYFIRNLDSIQTIYDSIESDEDKLAFAIKLKEKASALEQKMDSIKVKIEEKNNIKSKKEEKIFLASKAGKIWKKNPEWSRYDCERLSKGEVWIGMSYDMLKYMYGLPDHVNTSNYGQGNNYQWCWDDFNPGCFYGDDSGIITSYN